MSGHNKWSKVKNKKAVTDAKKGKIYTKMAKVIAVEIKKANGDKNAAGVQAAVKKAREYNVPNENIERALKKNDNAAQMESILYEAYGPGGVGIMIETLTDSKNRTVQDIKHILVNNLSNQMIFLINIFHIYLYVRLLYVLMGFLKLDLCAYINLQIYNLKMVLLLLNH